MLFRSIVTAQALEPVAWKTALTGGGSWVESGLEAGSPGGRRGAPTFAPVRWQLSLFPALTDSELNPLPVTIGKVAGQPLTRPSATLSPSDGEREGVRDI